jgi:hypothetical protein
VNIPRRPKTVEVTTHVPEHLAEAFGQATQEFFAQARGGLTSGQRAAEIRAQDRDAGLDSLAYLFGVAESDTGQSARVAQFLAGLYNGPRYPFDLTDLRALDDDLFEHCMAVLRMDHRPDVEVHRYFPDGGKRWEKMIADWSLDKRAAPEPEPEPNARYQASYETYSNAPGYRSVTLCVLLNDAERTRPVDLHFSAADTESIARDLLEVLRHAWEPREHRSVPLDARDGDRRPRWL